MRQEYAFSKAAKNPYAKKMIVATLWRQLNWPHFSELLPLKTHKDPFFRTSGTCWKLFGKEFRARYSSHGSGAVTMVLSPSASFKAKIAIPDLPLLLF